MRHVIAPAHRDQRQPIFPPERRFGEAASSSAQAQRNGMSLIAIEASLQPALRPSRRIPRTIIASDDGAPTRMGTTDRFGLCHSSNEAGAVAAFEAAVQALAAHQPSTGADLARALASDRFWSPVMP